MGIPSKTNFADNCISIVVLPSPPGPTRAKIPLLIACSYNSSTISRITILLEKARFHSQRLPRKKLDT